MTTTADNEQSLINRIINRDEAALSELYAGYSARVYGIALYILKNAAMAEEATQDTFLKVWDSAHRWNAHQSQLSTWILTIARFTAIDIVRREHRHAGQADIEDELYLCDDEADTVHSMDWDDAGLLQSLVTELPQEQYQAIELAFFRGMSHQEIASYLSEPLGTIKSRIRLGLQVLRGRWLMKTR